MTQVDLVSGEGFSSVTVAFRTSQTPLLMQIS